MVSSVATYIIYFIKLNNYYIESVLMLGQHVDKSDLSRLLGKRANHVLDGILPPRNVELYLVPLAIGLYSRQMKVSSPRTINLGGLRGGVNMSAWLYRC